MSETWEYKNFSLTRYWGKYGMMWQITQDTGYVGLTKRDLKSILRKVGKENV